MNRQKLALFLLLIALVGAVAYAFLRSPRQQEAPVLKNRPGVKATTIRKEPGAQKTAAAPAGGVHLDLLQGNNAVAGGYRRNIFAPLFKEEEKPGTLKLPPPPPPPKKLPPPPPPAATPVPPPPPPPPTQAQMDETELAKIVFLGFLKKGGERTVFLSKGGEIFVVKKGGQVGPKFRVADLTDDAITIKSVDSDRQMVIPLVENRSLSTRRK
ncbi:type II secretion system protein PulP [Geomonas terrae]|uniref:Type II secretion system protein PulP n=1 Tax=Geomonas terrae TaxID=2562681 RepID=A0A4S1CCV2_9BACT|nr:type II secretion system protein PulP [Geomonas terrae]TGU70860.1 type II secretion system protein PulP [Geomonas terrae]